MALERLGDGCLLAGYLVSGVSLVEDRGTYLWEVNTKSTHVHAVQEGTKVLIEASEALVD